MKGIAREFLVLSMGTVFVYLLVAHYTGAEGIARATGSSLSEIYKTLQGR